MKISTFDLNLFVVLNAIYTEGSLTKAAEVVGITQPAVSNALARLREKFDDDLFIRTGSGMTPTQKTENIILDVKKALDLMQKSVNEPDEFNPETSELTFRISLSDISEERVLPYILKKIKTITTIHDVIVFLRPEFFNLKHRIVVGHLTRSAIKNSNHIITVSDSTKREILELFPSIDSEKITVTYEASDMEMPSSDMMNKVFTEFPELPKNYLLSLGTLEPRKNLKRLIEAFRNLRSNNRINDIDLVLVGGKGWLESGIEKAKRT